MPALRTQLVPISGQLSLSARLLNQLATDQVKGRHASAAVAAVGGLIMCFAYPAPVTFLFVRHRSHRPEAK